MKEINKLVNLVTNRLKSSFDVIDLSGDVLNPGKEQQLYNGVLNGKYPTDEVASDSMYSSDIYDQRFRMLKSRLRYKLYDLLYYLDFEGPDYSDTNRAQLECTEYLHKANILMVMEEYGMVEKQINKAITLADSFQFTAIKMKALEIMRRAYSKLCQPTDLKLTLVSLEGLRKIHAMEEEANDLYDEMTMTLTKSIHSRIVSVDKAKGVTLQLKELWKKSNSFNIFEQYYKLSVWHSLLEGDYQSALKLIADVDKTAAKIPVTEERVDTAYNNYFATKAYLNLGNFEDGLLLAKSGLKQLDKSSKMWFELAELYFTMALQSKNFNLADEVLTKVLKNPNYKRASETTIERWKLFRIYLNFADLEANRLKRVRFKDAYYASDFYFKELKGYYLSLPLLEFVHLLKKGSPDQAISKLEDADNYFYKHLNEPGKNQREKQLHKCLKTLRSSKFDVKVTQEKVGAYLAKMAEKKLNEAFSDYELIPYEDLWKIIISVVEEVNLQKNL